MRARLKTGIAALAVAQCFAVHAETLPAEVVDIPIPDSPAAAAVANTGTILRPSTVREFAASLGSTINRSGKMKPLVALEVAPYLMIRRDQIDTRRYAKGVNIPASKELGYTVLNWPDPFSLEWTLANTSISFATGAKDDGEFAKRSAIGLKIPLFDSGDPRLNFAYSTCIALLNQIEQAAKAKAAEAAKAASAGAGPLGPPIGGPVIDYQLGAKDKSPARIQAEAACATKAAKANEVQWSGQSAALAFAQTYTDLGDDKKADLKKDARQFWASFAWGFASTKPETRDTLAETRGGSQIVLQYKLVRDAIDTEAAALGSVTGTANVRYNANAGHVKWRFGSATANFDISGTEQRRKYIDGKRDRVRTLAVGAEFKVSDYWVLLTYGREQSNVAGNKPFVLLNFKHSIGKEPNLTPS